VHRRVLPAGRLTVERRTWPPLVVAFVAVAVLKIALVAAWGDPPPLHDEAGYVATGEAVADWWGGDSRFDDPTQLGRVAWHNPGYSALFGLAACLFGEAAPPIRVLQALAGLLAGLVLFHALRRRVSRAGALCGAAVLWLHPSMLFFGVALWPVALATLFTATAALCAIRLADSPDDRARQWALGLVLAPLPFLAAPALFLLPFVAIELGARRALRVVGPTLALWLPWVVLVSVNLGTFTPMDFAGPQNLALGNHPAIAGDRGSLWGDPIGKAVFEDELAEACPQAGLPERTRCEARYAREVALETVRDDPIRTGIRGIRRLAETWVPDRFAVRHLTELGRGPPTWLAPLLTILHVVLLLAALSGLATPTGRRAARAVAIWCIPVLLTVGFTRLRQPVLPWLIIAGAVGITASRGEEIREST